MARLFSETQDAFIYTAPELHVPITDDILWLDLLDPTPEEEDYYEAQLDIELPLREELRSIEPSSRLYKENGAVYLAATVVHSAESEHPRAEGMAFILKGHLLITIRYSDPRSFTVFSDYLSAHYQDYKDGPAILCGLLEAVVERGAEVLEKVNIESDTISRLIFSESAIEDYKRIHKTSRENHNLILHKVAVCQDLTAKVRESLVSIGRLTRYTGLIERVQGRHLEEQLRSIDKDVISLTDQASYMSNNVSFLLNAALGMINAEQNSIIKFFSVVAVVFLPPTLIASIYGMNFTHMPELHTHFGYPIALFLMFLSAVGPYIYFKVKRWL